MARKTAMQKHAEARAAIDGLRADLRRGQTIYVKRSDSNVRVIRLFRVEVVETRDPAERKRRPEGCRLVEITQDVRRALGLRETRNGLSIGGGGSNPCFDTVYALSCALWPGYALRCEEV